MCKSVKPLRLFWHKRSVDVAPKRQTEMKPRHAGEASRVHPGSAKLWCEWPNCQGLATKVVNHMRLLLQLYLIIFNLTRYVDDF